MSETNAWGKVLKSSMNLPIVRVNREAFLKKELAPYYSEERIDSIINGGIMFSIDKKTLDRLVKGCINFHTTAVCSVSALAGIPGGWALAGTIPADIAQFYGHVLSLAQKILYLYGYPDLHDDNNNLSDDAANVLTICVGLMMGCQAAEVGLKNLLEMLSKGVAEKLAKQALTKTAIYQFAKTVAAWLGVKLTKDGFIKIVAKSIPLVGAPISASVTYFTFKPMAKKLKDFMNQQYEFRAQVS